MENGGIKMNTVNLIGRLGKDNDLRYTQSGKPVLSNTLAVTRKFKNANGEKETDWINFVMWGKGAEIFSNYAHKGSQVGLVGSIQTRNYENKQGQKVYVTEVNVTDFDFLDSKEQSYQPKEAEPVDISDNDLPF